MQCIDNRTQEVKELSGLDITGNVVPINWFTHIKLEDGKPDTNSILILSDIVYWYRAKIVRDEQSGQIIRLDKKFAGDYLQRSYQQFTNLFGFSRKQIQRCLAKLEDLNLIHKIKKDIKTESGLGGSLLYIQLKVAQLKKITLTYPPQENVMLPQGNNPCNFEGATLVTSKDFPYKETKTTNKDYSSSYKKEEDEYLQKNKNIAITMVDIFASTIGSDKQYFLNAERIKKLTTVYTMIGNDLNKWKGICEQVKNTPFLQGVNETGFIVTIHWLSNCENVQKVMDGIYYTSKKIQQKLQEQIVCSEEELYQEIVQERIPTIQNFKKAAMQIDKDVYIAYLRNAQLNWQDNKINISSDSRFIVESLEGKYLSYLEKVADKLGLEIGKINHLKVEGKNESRIYN